MKSSIKKTEQLADTLVIIGVGLLGGSIAIAARERGLVNRVIGVGRSQERLDQAVAAGILDQGTTVSIDAVKQADLVIVCTPVDCIAQEVIAIHPHLSETCIVTDVGSTKGVICQQIDDALGTGTHRFIGSHPLAGSEKTGFEASTSDLFEHAAVVITPQQETLPDRTEHLNRFWAALGANVILMDPKAHDKTLAMTSHLPHLVASALAASVQEKDLPLAATGYGDTTRIAAGDPQLWTSIFLQNQSAMLEVAQEFQQRLSTLIEAVEVGNADRLSSLLEAGKRHRDHWKKK